MIETKFEVFRKEADAFINGTYGGALFGASSTGSIFMQWLKAIGQERRIKYCLDNNPNKHNTLFCGLPVYSADKLDEDKETAIVITSDFYKEIAEELQKNNVINPILAFDQRFPYCSDIGEHKPLDHKEVYAVYNTGDAETRESLEYCLFLRERYKGGAVYTLDTKFKTYPSIDYWATPTLDLGVSDRLTVIDAGAYTGDTLQSLKGRYGRKIAGYHAFEPNVANCKALKKNVALDANPVDGLVIYDAGVSDASGQVTVSDEGDGMVFNLNGKGGETVKILAIDDVALDVQGKLCIKMDIEGFEMNALKGAEATIKTHKPELAICVYHKNADILEIPKYIKSLVPEYNVILRGGSHMVCYASVERFDF